MSTNWTVEISFLCFMILLLQFEKLLFSYDYYYYYVMAEKENVGDTTDERTKLTSIIDPF